MRRLAPIPLALLYAVILGGLLVETLTAPADAAGRAGAMAFLTVGGGITALCTVPALALAALNRAPGWALGLAMLPGVLLLGYAVTQAP